MSAFPNGVSTKDEAVLLLSLVDGRTPGVLGEWDIDDFMSIPQADPAIERCRLRVSGELIDLLSSGDPAVRARIPVLIDSLIEDLTDEGSVG